MLTADPTHIHPLTPSTIPPDRAFTCRGNSHVLWLYSKKKKKKTGFFLDTGRGQRADARLWAQELGLGYRPGSSGRTRALPLRQSPGLWLTQRFLQGCLRRPGGSHSPLCDPKTRLPLNPHVPCLSLNVHRKEVTGSEDSTHRKTIQQQPFFTTQISITAT